MKAKWEGSSVGCPCPGTSLKAALTSHAAIPLSAPELKAWGWPGSAWRDDLSGGSSTGLRSASTSAVHHQRFKAAEQPPLPRAPTASLPQHLSAAIQRSLRQQRPSPPILGRIPELQGQPLMPGQPCLDRLPCAQQAANTFLNILSEQTIT